MNIELIDRILKPLDDFISKETELLPFAEDRGFIPLKIQKENFHDLGFFGKEMMLTAIDGGNANILGAPNFSLDFIRVAAVSYSGNKKAGILKKEFFCFIKVENADDKIHYSVDIYGDNLFDDNISIKSEFSTLDGERYKLEISSISGIIRRYAELRLAKSIIETSTNESYLLIDGSIKAKTEEELQLITDLLKKAREKNISAGFLSKTCRLLTKNAASLNSALNELGPKSSWFYYPVFKINREDYLGEVYFVKLHAKSEHIFILELDRDTNNIHDYILSLSMNSNDPIFYGYPYSLIEADKIARVSNKEKEYLKTLFLSKVKNKEKLGYLLSNLDAHDILDKLSF